MDNRNEHIEQLLERYFNAETTLEEEQALRTYFSSADVPAHLEQWRALFVADASEVLGDDFDARLLSIISAEEQAAPVAASSSPADTDTAVKAQVITLRSRLMPLFKAAAVVAVILTIGGALQAPFDSTWDTPDDYARLQQELDSAAILSPVQAENISDVAADSSKVFVTSQPTN